MNREVLKAIDTNVIPISRLAALFDTFGLRHSSKVLPDLLEAAEQGNASYKQLLLSIFETEVKGRNARVGNATMLPLTFRRTSSHSKCLIRWNWNPELPRLS